MKFPDYQIFRTFLITFLEIKSIFTYTNREKYSKLVKCCKNKKRQVIPRVIRGITCICVVLKITTPESKNGFVTRFIHSVVRIFAPML